MHPFNIWNEKPTDVTILILFVFRRIFTCFGATGPSSGEFTQLFTQPLVQWLYRSGRVLIQSTRPERYSHWTNSFVNSCVNSPEDGPIGPKHVEIRRYMNKIEIVTSVGFSFHMLKTCPVQKALNDIKIDHLVNHQRVRIVLSSSSVSIEDCFVNGHEFEDTFLRKCDVVFVGL
jgi:hypothetical protein